VCDCDKLKAERDLLEAQLAKKPAVHVVPRVKTKELDPARLAKLVEKMNATD
jgi:hypothetical protein